MANFTLISTSKLSNGERATLKVGSNNISNFSNFQGEQSFSIASPSTAFLVSGNNPFIVSGSGNSVDNEKEAAFGQPADHRAGKINNLLDIQKYFEKNKILILGDRLEIEVNTAFLPLDEDNFFFVEVKYKRDGQKKRFFNKLGVEGNKILVGEKHIYAGIDLEEIDLESGIHLFYQRKASLDGNPAEITPVTSFEAVFPDQDELLQEVQALKAGVEAENFETTLWTFLALIYGDPDKENVKKWLIDHEISN